MTRDRERYATGWWWLDPLTEPYWLLRVWWTRRKSFRKAARPGESWRDAQARFREANEALAAVEDTTVAETGGDGER